MWNKKGLIFEILLLILFILLMVGTFIYNLLGVKSDFLIFSTLFIPIILISYYSFKTNSIAFVILILLTTLPFIGSILSIYNFSFSTLLIAFGRLSVLALSGLIVFGTLKFTTKTKIKIASVSLISLTLFHIFLPVLAILCKIFFYKQLTDLLNFPVLFLLIFIYSEKEIMISKPSMSNALKALMLNFTTLICLNVILNSAFSN